MTADETIFSGVRSIALSGSQNSASLQPVVRTLKRLRRSSGFLMTSQIRYRRTSWEGDGVHHDEWDRELVITAQKSCRVIQRENRRGNRDFVEQVRSRYSGIISSVRHQFQMLKPESLRRVKGELDGEDYDLQAVIDHHVDLRTTGNPSDRLYIRRIRREREVAVSFLLDMSSSTARTITRHHQPYPGRARSSRSKSGAWY
jgi:hypothetical protein